MDKFEPGKLLLVLILATTIVLLNAQVSKRTFATAKLDIALGVLSEEPSDGTNALRKWAIDVLRAPQGNVELGEAAAAELRKQALPIKN